ncbi:MAG: Ig-like domain-containing protein [Candidatus Saccharimonadales bacterium]
MANTKLNILHQPRQLLFLISLVLASFVFLHAPLAHAAACPAPATDMGSVSSTVNVTTAGTYRVWSRIMSGTASSDNSYSLEIDGSSCYVVGDNASMATGSWQWVNYQNGTTGSTIDVSLTAGNHTLKMIGREDGVKLDRVGFTTDTTCTPSGTGDNCFPPADTTPPTVSISSPTGGAKVKGTVTVNATASDDSGTVSKVELYVDGVMVGSADTTAPFSFSWNTTTASNAAHSLTVKAYDPSNNVTTSSAVSVTVDNSPPTVSLTAPPAGTISGTAVTISATASDNVAVSSVDFYYGTNLITSDTTSPYSYSWSTCAIPNGNYALTAKANDSAGNTTTSTAVNVTISNTSSCGDTQAPTTSITSPVAGSILSGTTNAVSATASDNVGVTKVELYIDGSLVATDVASPYSFNINTTSYANGNHTLVTKAYDAVPNIGTSASVTVSVNNGTSNPGDVTGDGHVTLVDLSTLLSHYGTSGGRTSGDLNNDGVVNIIDLSTLLTYYGT